MDLLFIGMVLSNGKRGTILGMVWLIAGNCPGLGVPKDAKQFRHSVANGLKG